MDGLWQALHHSVRLPFFSVSFWVNTIDLSETASTWRVFLPSPPPPIHPSRKRDRVTWFSAKLAFDSLSKLFHCCRIHEHPCGLSPPSYFFFLFFWFIPSKSISLCRLNARDAWRREEGELNREGKWPKLRESFENWEMWNFYGDPLPFPLPFWNSSLLDRPLPPIHPLCTPV